MKKKKVISMQVATMMLVGFATTQALTPIDVQAAYKTPYEYAVQDYKNKYEPDIFQASTTQAGRAKETWFRAIYPQYSSLDMAKGEDIIKLWNQMYPNNKKAVTSDSLNELWDNGFFTRDPYEGYNVQTLWEDFSKLDTTKQYFPTMEFPVGKNYCYVDGKKFMLEDTIINKDGVVLVPFGHLETILSSNPHTAKYWLGEDDSTQTIDTNLLSSFCVQKKMMIHSVTANGEARVANGISHSWTSTPMRQMTKNDLAYGATVIRNSLYVPVRWLAQGTNVGKAEWYAKEQLAVIPGQYHKEAANYGIFKQPGKTSQYDLFKDWDMIPQQPVRYLSKGLTK